MLLCGWVEVIGDEGVGFADVLRDALANSAPLDLVLQVVGADAVLVVDDLRDPVLVVVVQSAHHARDVGDDLRGGDGVVGAVGAGVAVLPCAWDLLVMCLVWGLFGWGSELTITGHYQLLPNRPALNWNRIQSDSSRHTEASPNTCTETNFFKAKTCSSTGIYRQQQIQIGKTQDVKLGNMRI